MIFNLFKWKKMFFGLAGLILLHGCVKSPKTDVKKVVAKNGISISAPVKESEFYDSLTYKHVQIWFGDRVIFSDSSQNEYLFDDLERWPSIRQLKNNQFEVLLKTSNAPDLNRLHGVYFNDSGVFHLEEYPFFEEAPQDYNNDGILEYRGIMHLVDAYDNPDSCYYNPELFYSITDQGLILDSALTRSMMEGRWGKFYGFGSLDVVIPCPWK